MFLSSSLHLAICVCVSLKLAHRRCSPWAELLRIYNRNLSSYRILGKPSSLHHINFWRTFYSLQTLCVSEPDWFSLDLKRRPVVAFSALCHLQFLQMMMMMIRYTDGPLLKPDWAQELLWRQTTNRDEKTPSTIFKEKGSLIRNLKEKENTLSSSKPYQILHTCSHCFKIGSIERSSSSLWTRASHPRATRSWTAIETMDKSSEATTVANGERREKQKRPTPAAKAEENPFSFTSSNPTCLPSQHDPSPYNPTCHSFWPVDSNPNNWHLSKTTFFFFFFLFLFPFFPS